MAFRVVRVGIIGAGAITRRRHLPGLRSIDRVEVVGVVNRTPESTQRAAAELEIPNTYSDWRSLVDDPAIDAVVIGAWPNLHCEAACAALAAGKHVLCEARMSRDLAEARKMEAEARRRPGQVAQLVPSPYGLVSGPAIQQLIEEGYLGEFRELVVLGADDQFWDYTVPLHWRQCRETSGNNVLSLGILHETAMRWSPPPTQVFAQSQLFEPERPVPEQGRNVKATVPDSVQVLTMLEGGGRGLYQQSGAILYGPGKQIHLYGSRSAIKVEFAADGSERLSMGYAGDGQLRQVEIPPDQKGRWRVEQEFIGAIRGEEQVELTTFAAGVKYMEFVEAVARSSAANTPVALPLAD